MILLKGRKPFLMVVWEWAVLVFTLQLEYESRHLPTIDLRRFDGSQINWPEFIQNFKDRVHNKVSFNDNVWMERLLSVLDGDAKKSIEPVGSSGIFYATSLKSLKRDYVPAPQ